MSLTLLPTPRTLFLLLCCLIQPQFEDVCFVLLYFVLLCLDIFSCRSAFSKGRQRGRGSEREERKVGSWGSGRRGKCAGMCGMREERRREKKDEEEEKNLMVHFERCLKLT